MTELRALSELPRVDALLGSPELAALPRARVKEAVREALDLARARLRGGGFTDRAAILADVLALARARMTPGLRPVINATGVVLHTNLGRAPWSEAAVAAAGEVARGYCNLEINLETGARGSRAGSVRELLRALSGAEDALVVNNGAAALLLALTALASGRAVLVSRGELVEIGGSFRVPEIISACGARLVEVGTTNRTRAADFARAVNDEVSVLLAVHPSNFRVSGFVERPSPAELVSLSASRRLHAVYDVGSGALTTDGEEPGVRDMVGAGFDLVTFSGDKLLGGPQAGIVVGKAALVERLRTHPLYRALRVDKVTLAALEATLRGWRDGAPPPVAVFRALDRDALRVRAEAVRDALRARLGQVGEVELTLVEVEGAVGGGSLPGAVLPGVAIAVRCSGLDKLSAALRRGEPPVIARVADERLLLDLRAVRAQDEPTLVDAVAAAVLARAP